MKDFLQKIWETNPNLVLGTGSVILLIGGFSVSFFNPELGVSEIGIEECLDRSNRADNRFTAEKIYRRCMRNINKEIALDKKNALERKKKREEDKKKRDEEVKAQKLANKKKYKNLVDESLIKFDNSEWDFVSNGKNYYGFAKDKKKIGMYYVVFRQYFLPKYEQPLLTPENYFTFNTWDRNWRNSITEWFVVDCENRKTSIARGSNRYFIKSEEDPLSALNSILKISSWNEPSKKGNMRYDFTNYACTSEK